MDRATLKQELEKVIAVGPGISRHIVAYCVMLGNLSNIMSETMTKIHDAEDENVDGEKGGLKMTPSDNICFLAPTRSSRKANVRLFIHSSVRPFLSNSQF